MFTRSNSPYNTLCVHAHVCAHTHNFICIQGMYLTNLFMIWLFVLVALA